MSQYTKIITSLLCLSLGAISFLRGACGDCNSGCYNGSGAYVTGRGDSDTCSFRNVIRCVNNGATAGPIIFQVGDTDGVDHDTCSIAQDVTIKSEYVGGTKFTSTANNVVIDVSNGAVVTLGPSGSQPISIGKVGDPNFTGKILIDEGATLIFDQNMTLPSTQTECEQILLKGTGSLYLNKSGTLGSRIYIPQGKDGEILLGNNVNITQTGPILAYATFGDEDTNMVIRGTGVDPAYFTVTTTNSADLGIDDLALFNTSFAFATNILSNAGGNGSIVLNESTLVFLTNGMEMTDKHRLHLEGNGYIEAGENISVSINRGFDNGSTVSGKLIKKGAGTITLLKESTYILGTEIREGTLSISNLNQINAAASSAAVLISGGVLEVNAAGTFAGEVIVSSGGICSILGERSLTFPKLTFTSGGKLTTDAQSVITVAGPLVFDSNTTLEITHGSSFIVNGQLQGSGSFALQGSAGAIGSLVLNGSSTFTGSITLSNILFATSNVAALSRDVNIYLGSTGQLQFSGGSNDFIVGDITGSQGASLVNNGRSVTVNIQGSTLSLLNTLSGTGGFAFVLGNGQSSAEVRLGQSNVYTGSTTLGSGVSVSIAKDASLGSLGSLQLNSGSFLEITDTMTFNRPLQLLNGLATVELRSGVVATFAQTISGTGPLALTGGQAVLGNNTFTGGVVVNSSTLAISSASSLGSGTSHSFTGGGIAVTNTMTLTSAFTTVSGSMSLLPAPTKVLTLSGAISGGGGIKVSGGGIVALTGSNSYTGDTTIENGVLQISSESNLGGTGIVLMGQSYSATLDVLNTISSSQRITFEKNTESIIQVALGKSASFSGDVSIKTGPPILKKAGGGALFILPATKAAIPQLTVIIEEGTFTGNTNFLENSSFVLQQANTSLTFDEGVDGSYYGANDGSTVGGLGSVHFKSSGVLRFLVPVQGSQLGASYQGGTYLEEGTVAISKDWIDNKTAVLGKGTVPCYCTGGAIQTVAISSQVNSLRSKRPFILQTNTTFITDDKTIFTLEGDLSGGYNFTKQGVGELVLAYPMTYQGKTYLEEGTLTVSVTNATGSGLDSGIICQGGGFRASGSSSISISTPFTLEEQTAFTVDSSIKLNLLGVIDGSFGLTKEGSGTLSLLNTNNYAGDTKVANGVLEISSDSNIGTGGIVLMGQTYGATLKVLSSMNSTKSLTFAQSTQSIIEVVAGQTANFSEAVVVETGSPGLKKMGGGNLTILPSIKSTLPQLTVVIGEGNFIGNTNFLENSSCSLSQASSALTFQETGNTSYYGSSNGSTITGNGSVHFKTTGIFQFLVPLSGSQLGASYQGGTYLEEGIVAISKDWIDSSKSVLGGTGSACYCQGGSLKTVTTSSQTNALRSKRTFILQANTTFITDDKTIFTLEGDISGGYDITKQGAGELVLAYPMTYQGKTYLEEGTLTASVSYAISNGLDSGVVCRGGVFRASGGSSVLLLTSFIFETDTTFITDDKTIFTLEGDVSGGYNLTKQGVGELVLAYPMTYQGKTYLEEGTLTVSVTNATGSGLGSGIICQGGGFRASGSSSISISTPFTLEEQTAFTVDSSIKLNLLGVIDGSFGLTKEGSGTLSLQAYNEYSGNTVVSEGILSVDGYIPGDVYVEEGAELKGTGNVGGTVYVEKGAFVSAGNSIGVLTIAGDLDLAQGSSVNIEISPTEASRIDVEEDIVFSGLAFLNVLPQEGDYTGTSTYTVLVAGGDVEGDFQRVLSPPSFFLRTGATYFPHAVELSVTAEEVTPVIVTQNIIAVTTSLNDVIASNRATRSFRLTEVFASLLPINGTAEVSVALNEMQPAACKNLVVSQQTASTQVQTALLQHISYQVNTLDCAKRKDSHSVWISGLGNALNQKSEFFKGSPQVGYRSSLGGFVAGLDAQQDDFYVGFLGGFTSSHVGFHQDRGSGDINTGYFGLYFSGVGEAFYASISATGGWSSYSTRRVIEYTGVNKVASSTHAGMEFRGMFDGGMNLPIGRFNIRPFDRVDYQTSLEMAYEETGASSWNLRVNQSNAIFLRNELGLIFATCMPFNTGSVSIAPKISWVREVRIKGANYTASFTRAGADPFTVTGYFPSRSLFSPGLSINGTILEDRILFGLYFEGEFVRGYNASRYGGEFKYQF